FERVPYLTPNSDPLAQQEAEIEQSIVGNDDEVCPLQGSKRLAEIRQGKVSDADVGGSREEYVGSSVHQQAGADDLMPAKEAGRFEIENNRCRSPRQCFLALRRIVVNRDH